MAAAVAVEEEKRKYAVQKDDRLAVVLKNAGRGRGAGTRGGKGGEGTRSPRRS